MPVELSVQGEGFARFQRKLKTLDKDIQRDIRKEMNATIREVSAPVISEVRAAARSNLPRSGGLATRVAEGKVSVSITQRGVSVRVKGLAARSTERGSLRHPVYARAGQRRVWVTQAIRPNWFTDQMRRETPLFRSAIAKAVERAVERAASV